MAKKEKTQYADSFYEVYDYICAWLASGGNISLSQDHDFYRWLRSIEINGLKLSGLFIRRILGEYETLWRRGVNPLAVSALEYKMNEIKRDIRIKQEMEGDIQHGH